MLADMPKRLTTEQFVAKARKIHGDKYDYSKVVYTKMHDYITVTCPKHGDFLQKAYSHLNGKGCSKCAKEESRSKLIFGVAHNDCDGDSHTRAYVHWRNMLVRCFDEKYKKESPTYTNCSCCDEWLLFSNFKRWYESFNYQDYHLDKDILVKNNKVYSPETCCLVPPEINTLFTKRQNDRGKQPIGVCYIKRSGKYSATIHKLRNVHLGFFDTPEEAFQAYKSAKEQYVKERATQYFQEGKITQRVYQALMEYQVEITD